MAETAHQRYEAVSAEWVDAMRQYLSDKVAAENLEGITASASFEYTDPPAHLLRGGRETIGYYIRVRDGKIEVGDHPLPGADAQCVFDYNLIAPTYRYSAEEDLRWMSEHMEKAIAEGRMKISGDASTLQTVLIRADMRDGFFAAYTA
jgi:hypothetical protein